jgi:hypothetical protein
MGITYKDLQWVNTGERLTAETFEKYRTEGGSVVIFSIPEPAVRNALGDPLLSTKALWRELASAAWRPR